jgi:hypothetical protein
MIHDKIRYGFYWWREPIIREYDDFMPTEWSSYVVIPSIGWYQSEFPPAESGPIFAGDSIDKAVARAYASTGFIAHED